MTIASIDAVSLNAKITHGPDANARTWTSDEDWVHFVRIRDSFEVLVMGSGSYDAVRPEPEAGRLRIVLTSRVQDYTEYAVPGRLEFSSESPRQLVSRLESQGITKTLLVGGRVNTSFWNEQLVDEMYVTVEPCLFHEGRDFLDALRVDVALKLQSCTQLNRQGAIVLHYKVDSPKLQA